MAAKKKSHWSLGFIMKQKITLNSNEELLQNVNNTSTNEGKCIAVNLNCRLTKMLGYRRNQNYSKWCKNDVVSLRNKSD